MPRYLAFLRAINVGGRTVRMDVLRKHFDSLGFSNVETLIASGNVIFETRARNAEALEKRIEIHLQRSLGFPVGTFIRSTAELGAIAKHEPFPSEYHPEAGHALYITFLRAAPSIEAQRKLLTFRNAIDDFHVHGRELYWLARQKMMQSIVTGAQIEKTMGMSGTMRNVTTVRKLATAYAGS